MSDQYARTLGQLSLAVGASGSTTSAWRRRYTDFPEPTDLGWDVAAVEAFMKQHGLKSRTALREVAVEYEGRDPKPEEIKDVCERIRNTWSENRWQEEKPPVEFPRFSPEIVRLLTREARSAA